MEERTKTLCKVALGAYNIDYDDFERRFIKEGIGMRDLASLFEKKFEDEDKRIARHIWDKWKVEHQDNFLWAFGNLTTKNQEKTTRTILGFADEHKYCEE